MELGRLWGREEGAGGKNNQEAEWKGHGADRLDLRETFRARSGLWLKEGAVGTTLRWGSGGKCSLGEILRLVWDLVGVRLPGNIQGGVSRAL